MSASELPAPVARFLAMVEDQPPMDTVILDTTAWMRRGPIRIPLAITMAHRLGSEFVHDIRIGRRPLAVRFGLDAYVGGRGVMRVGGAISAGPHFDQGALIAMWGEVLGFPSTWLHRPDVRWEPMDASRSRLVVAGPEGDLPITVAFDRASGLPAGCRAERYKGDGPKVGWTGRTPAWRRIDGVLVPASFSARWDDEPQPWIHITTQRVRPNAPVDELLALGRAALDRSLAAAGSTASPPETS